MAKLLLKFNAAVIKEIAIQKDVLTVGRKPENDIVIDNPAVSGHHCKIVRQAGAYFLEDLDSTNGTYVNEKRVMKAGLRDNDVIGLAKHALVFLEEKPVVEAGDKTMVLPAREPDHAAKAAPSGSQPKEKVGGLRMLKGVVGQMEYELKGLSTYIGKSDRVQIPIKGSGLFGSAPEVAASIHRKPEGYVLVAVKEGYPVVNGASVSGQVSLNDGDLIDCGATTMQFYLKDA